MQQYPNGYRFDPSRTNDRCTTTFMPYATVRIAHQPALLGLRRTPPERTSVRVDRIPPCSTVHYLRFPCRSCRNSTFRIFSPRRNEKDARLSQRSSGLTLVYCMLYSRWRSSSRPDGASCSARCHAGLQFCTASCSKNQH